MKKILILSLCLTNLAIWAQDEKNYYCKVIS